MIEDIWGLFYVCLGVEEDVRKVKKEFYLIWRRSGSSGRMIRGKLIGIGI